MKETEKNPRGRQLGFRKKNPLNIIKGIRFTENEFEGLTKARGITGETESDFMREAIDSKVKKTLKKAAKVGIEPL